MALERPVWGKMIASLYCLCQMVDIDCVGWLAMTANYFIVSIQVDRFKPQIIF